MAFTFSATLRPAAAVTYAISSSFNGALCPAVAVTYAISSSLSDALRPATTMTYSISGRFQMFGLVLSWHHIVHKKSS